LGNAAQGQGWDWPILNGIAGLFGANIPTLGGPPPQTSQVGGYSATNPNNPPGQQQPQQPAGGMGQTIGQNQNFLGGPPPGHPQYAAWLSNQQAMAARQPQQQAQMPQQQQMPQGLGGAAPPQGFGQGNQRLGGMLQQQQMPQRQAQQFMPMGGAQGTIGGGVTPQQQAPAGAQQQSWAPPQGGPAQSNYQSLMANPMSMNQGVQDQLYNRGQQGIDMDTANMQRRLREQSASSGFSGSGLLNQNLMATEADRMRNLSNLRRDIGIEAARTNTADLQQAAGMQLGAEGQLANQIAQQNAMQQGIWGQDWSNQAGLIGQMQGLQQGGMQDIMGYWDRLNALTQAGIQQPNQSLMQALAMRQSQLQPTSVPGGAAMVNTSSMSPNLAYAMGSGGGGGGQQGSGMWPMIGSAIGSWAGAGLPTPFGGQN